MPRAQICSAKFYITGPGFKPRSSAEQPGERSANCTTLVLDMTLKRHSAKVDHEYSLLSQ